MVLDMDFFNNCDDAAAVRKEASQFLRAHLFRNGGTCTREQAVAVVRAMCRPERLARLGATIQAAGVTRKIRLGEEALTDYGERYIRGEGCTKIEVDKLVVWACRDIVRNFIQTSGVLYDKNAASLSLSSCPSRVKAAGVAKRDRQIRVRVLGFLYASRIPVKALEINGGTNSSQCALKRLVKVGFVERVPGAKSYKITEKGIAFYLSKVPKERICQGTN